MRRVLSAYTIVIQENWEICIENKCQDSVIVSPSGRVIDIK